MQTPPFSCRTCGGSSPPTSFFRASELKVLDSLHSVEHGSGVAIDWVTSRSHSSARRRLNEQLLREADGPEESDSTKKSASGGKVFASQRTSALQPPPLPELDCTLRGHQHLLALRRGPWASVGLPQVPHGTGLDVSILPLLRVSEVGNLQSFAPLTVR